MEFDLQLDSDGTHVLALNSERGDLDNTEFDDLELLNDLMRMQVRFSLGNDTIVSNNYWG